MKTILEEREKILTQKTIYLGEVEHLKQFLVLNHYKADYEQDHFKIILFHSFT